MWHKLHLSSQLGSMVAFYVFFFFVVVVVVVESNQRHRVEFRAGLQSTFG